jgi:hypothetical protein
LVVDLIHVASAGKSSALVSSESPILFVGKNKALCMFFINWIMHRLDKTHKPSAARGLVATHLRVLHTSPFADQVFLVQFSHGGNTVEFVAENAHATYGLVVVDEAHHIFAAGANVDDRDRVSQLCTNAGQSVLLSDISQGGTAAAVTFPPDHKAILLTEVVRNSSRILTASLPFCRSEDLSDVTCHHGVRGPPLESFMFDKCLGDAALRFEKYVDGIIKSVNHIFETFPGAEIHDNLVILVPDVAFKEVLLPMLVAAFSKRVTLPGIAVVDAIDGAFAVKRTKSKRSRIVVDTLESFDGMERLFVLAVGLDSRLTTEACCGIYRAITRAHMFVCVVQEHVPGGWLEFTANMHQGEAEYDEARERGRVARKNLTVISDDGETPTIAGVEAEPAVAAAAAAAGLVLEGKDKRLPAEKGVGNHKVTVKGVVTAAAEVVASCEVVQDDVLAGAAAEMAVVIRQNVWNGNLNGTFETTVSRLAFNPMTPDIRFSKEFVFEQIIQGGRGISASFDGKGVLYWIGTKSGAHHYTNPHTMGGADGVVAALSSVADDGEGSTPDAFVMHDHDGNTPNTTDNAPNSWMSVDLGPNRRLLPTQYCLRHGHRSGNDRLIHWRFEASNDGTTWTVLKDHSNDESLPNHGFSVASWSIEPQPPPSSRGSSSQGYRYFRIHQTGKNVYGTNDLNCSGIELYGVLSDKKRATEMTTATSTENTMIVTKCMFEQITQGGKGKSASFDGGGVLHFIGTNSGTDSYTNPHTMEQGGVVAAMSSDGYGGFHPERFVMHTHDGSVCNYTRDIANSWMSVDLGRGRRLAPTYYCLRHGDDSGEYRLRHWRFEGSNNGSTWTVLKDHTNDNLLPNHGFGVAGWSVPQHREGTSAVGSLGFRSFRIISSGKNTNGDDEIWCAGIELYGVLSDDSARMTMLTAAVVGMAAKAAQFSGKTVTNCAFQQITQGGDGKPASFDGEGVLHWIATKSETKPYTNPHTMQEGGVVAAMSSALGSSSPEKFVVHDHDGKSANVTTYDSPNQWMSVDLGPGRQLVLNYYCLRHGNGTGDARPLQWRLQGSNDGSTWTVLKSHTNDDALPVHAFSVAAWAVDTLPSTVGGWMGFRHFRIIQFGKNANNSDNLCCAGIELYGVLSESDDDNTAVSDDTNHPELRGNAIVQQLLTEHEAAEAATRHAETKQRARDGY